MWLVSQLQNAMSATEPGEDAFMDIVRGMIDEETDSSDTRNLPLEVSAPISKIENCWYSNECLELQSSSCQLKPAKKPGDVVTPMSAPKDVLEYEIPKGLIQEKVEPVSVDLVEPPGVCAKMSCTAYNLWKHGDGDGVGKPETKAKLSMSSTALKSSRETACNECDPPEVEGANCVKCDSLPNLELVGSNKTDSQPGKKSSSKIHVQLSKSAEGEESCSKMEAPKKRSKKHESRKPEAVCLYKREKEVAPKRRSGATEVKQVKSQPAPLPFKKRNELPIHLRPLSPVHGKHSFPTTKAAKQPPIIPRPVICEEVSCKDTGTSTDVDDLISPRSSTFRTRSSSSKMTRIPMPFQTYCVGYSKISTVEQKFSIITGGDVKRSEETNEFARLHMRMHEDEPKTIEEPFVNEIREKRVVRPSSPNARRGRSLSIVKPTAQSSDVVSRFVQPSDLVKRIEMIRRKLTEAESAKSDDGVAQVTKSVSSYFKLGEAGSGMRARGAIQDFYELRDYHVGSGTLFEDPEFPADSSSLTHNGRTDRHYEWLRPGEIVDDPQLFVEGYSRFDVQQGELGDCWLLAAVANLTLYRRLFFQIVPDDQGFDEKYAGIFHFRFWQYGRWIDVVIDDRLPTYRGQLVYLHSNEENEFWSALLEKAYAKLHGSYEALKGGSTCEAMEDFTGGVTEMYEMKASPPNLFKIILKAYERGSLMGCSLEPDPNVLEAETPEGLIRGHAYSITRVKYVDIRTPNTVGKIPLLRLRNPWGNEIEWNGPWSDQSPEWRFIPDYEKTNLGLTVDHDGEFWMSLKDFQSRFDRLEICNLTPDSLTEEEISRGNMKQWEMSVFEGEWVRGVSSGGCRNFLESFPYNPQYRITLTEIDDDDDDNKCTVIIALLQKNRRSKKQRGVEFLSIGFAVYYLSDPSRAPKPLDLNYFKYNVSVARSPSFINLREVTCRFRLPPGTYCIVPSTYEPNEEGEFLLRVFSEKKNNMEMFDDPVAIKAPIATVASATPEKQVQDEEKIDEVRQYFIQLAGDDMEIDWEELKDVLDFATRKETANHGFSRDVCKSIVALLDADHSGKLGFEEFKSLWSLIKNAKHAFGTHDKDNSGSLSGFELRHALNSCGYLLNTHVLNLLMHRYGNKKAEIAFDEFILCALKLKTMIETYQRKTKGGAQAITLSFDDWIETTLYS